MHWRDQDPTNCSIARTLEVVGAPWTLLILRELFRDLHRFDEIQSHLGVSEGVLSRRLKSLQDADLVERRPYRAPDERTRHEYHLTGAGAELVVIFAALKAWGDSHLADSVGPATCHSHRGCGERVSVQLRCGRGHELAGAGEILVEQGPAARPLTAGRAG